MTPSEIEREVQRRVRLPYHRVISGDEAEGYLGEVPELPGCLTAGESAAEALANLDEAIAAWVEAALKAGISIPEPARGPVSISA
ncbi:MAG: type II toxin-antitoxin system HicB family antitoxin [Dehalococcoidia bacterium]|jgi:antitoxin HicB|uniref:type II toxin-antitoxin system HicB family antitoxin n=1 Tax=Candidatus Amarobacter glycogenicus TaxID=3140699 RepID=UPI001D5A73C9|nr:type II toxin-antitoxin system HicB family antitoxin [Dehalococcoidia bacterium]MBK7329247.1 type II toxin-antitoxin system HicB family antitoxin [Dehalococcoidia bacterium]MBK7725277.1 type II toxin-antitoxin system HicB family antitoxin [Dehalococcoidia bacterium]MBK8561670.1 type II toxin-antitoxin system HicB family antitoxin [Dehalococcoidia bacterium]MBK9342766.1 type II toxin-antitoxin system HicB family antitoxin [Dehalococcoidia bacterium]